MAIDDPAPLNYEQWLRNILASAAREAIVPIFTGKELEEAEKPSCGDSDSKAWPREWSKASCDKEDCPESKEECDLQDLQTIREIEDDILAKVTSSIGNSDPRAAESYVDVLLKIQQYRKNKLEGY